MCAGGQQAARAALGVWSHAPFLGLVDAPDTAAPHLAGPAGVASTYLGGCSPAIKCIARRDLFLLGDVAPVYNAVE